MLTQPASQHTNLPWQRVRNRINKWMLSRSFAVGVTLVALLVLVACSATSGPSAEFTCEQRYDLALERGVPYTEALGDYTQCLIDRGDTINTSIRNR